MVRLISLFVVIFFCFWFPKASKRVTHGFRLAKCRLEWSTVPQWEADPLPAEKEQEIRAILEKPFTYLAKGDQSFVFLSQDGNYVLKLFHFNQCKIALGKKLKNQWKKWTKGHEIEEFLFKESVTRTFESYKLTYDLAKDLAALSYIHLNPKKTSLPVISIRDRLGRSYRIDPAQYRFILQKRAEPIRPTLSKALQSGSADPLIFSLFSLFKKLGDLGLANRDPKISRNFAYLNGEAIVIDAGSFFYDPIRAKEDANHFSLRFQNFLEGFQLKVLNTSPYLQNRIKPNQKTLKDCSGNSLDKP